MRVFVSFYAVFVLKLIDLQGGSAVTDELFSTFDFNNDGVITREEFNVAAQEMLLRVQPPRYSTGGSADESAPYGSPGPGSVGTDRTASDYASPSPSNASASFSLSTSSQLQGAVSVEIVHKRDVRTHEGKYTGPMLIDPSGAIAALKTMDVTPKTMDFRGAHQARRRR